MIYLPEYNKYLELVREGLIMTHNIIKYKSTLQIKLNSIGVKYNLNIIDKFTYNLDILNPEYFTNNELQYIIDINKDILGYYPSYIWRTNSIGEKGDPYDNEYLNNKYIKLKIRFEAKYDDGLYKNDLDVPDYAYHLSPSENKNNNLKYGLHPKSRKRKTEHPDRIYFLYDIDDYEKLLKSLKMDDKLKSLDRKYTLYKVKIPNDIIIHSDPNHIGAFFIYDFIHPEDIEIIKDEI